MKKRIFIVGAILAFSGTASAQEAPLTGALGTLLGPNGPVQALTRVPDAGSLAPVVDSLTGPNSDVLSGRIADNLHDVLTGLLVAQDPDQAAGGLERIVTDDVLGERGVLEALAGQGGGLPLSLGGGSALPVDGGLPGLGDSAPLSSEQLAQLQDLL